jgi:hypothetical protein
MGHANPFTRLGRQKTAQTQQHTIFEILRAVSSGETMFHLRAKVRGLKQFVSGPGRQKGAHIFYAPPAKTKVLL